MKRKVSKLLSVILAVLMLIPILSTSLTSINAAYENTYKNTGNQRVDILEVAKTQLGNTNGSKYGSGAWCAHFVIWCARQAGIDSSIIATTGWACADDMKIPYYSRSNYTPRAGDIVFFNWPSTSAQWDHVGIVESLNSDGSVTTIEGNNNGAVRRVTYSANGYSQYSRLSSIRGYGVPAYKGIERNTKIKVWAAKEEYGTAPSTFVVKNKYWLCYTLYDSNTGDLYNSYSNSNYKVTLTIYDPYGNVAFSDSINNSDKNRIGHTIQYIGKYRGEVTVSGDISGGAEISFTVKSDGKVTFNKTNISLAIPSNLTTTLNVNLSGNWPEKAGYIYDYDESIISHTQNSSIITITAKKSGNTNFTIIIVDKNNGNKEITRATCKITVTNDTYTVSYSANGGTGAPSSQTKIHGTNLTLSTVKPDRTGYGFSSWNTKSDGSGKAYNSGGIYSVNEGTTLYAIWKPNSYIVRYNANGGSGSMSDTTHYYDTAKSLRANAFTRSGYTFLGWSTSSSATSPIYYDIQSIKNLTTTNGGLITLYAIWGDSSAPTAKISSTHNAASSQTVSFTFSDNNGIAGYYWGTSSNYRSNIFTATSSSSASENVTSEGTYYLTVKDKNGNLSVTYKIGFSRITLNANGGKISHDYIIVETGSGVTLPTCTRNGYSFMGWNKVSNADSGLMYVTVSDNSTYYAVWKSNAVPVSMQITKAPNKIDYYIGDTLNVSGMELSVTYSDGSVMKINNSTINSGVELQNTNLKAEGEKKITVVYGGFKDTFAVYVKSPAISLSDYEVHLKKGEQHNITVNTDPENVTIKADSSDKRIVTIENGIIKAVDVGEADITIRFTYNGLTYKAICNITVEEPKQISFPDVSDSAWYAEGVYYCANNGYITGTDAGTFNPNGKLTREQFVVILARVAGADLTKYTQSKFSDVKTGDWYAASVIWASNTGYVNGVGNGKFGVGQNMTREQLATMFYRYAEKNSVSVNGKANLSGYTDNNSVSSWAKDACAWAVNAGLLSSTSTSSKTLSPLMTVTRAQAAKIFMSYDAYAAK